MNTIAATQTMRWPLRISFNWKFFYIVIAVLITLLLGLYIYQVIAVQQENFILSNYKDKISKIAEVNKALEINLSQASSLKNLEDIVGRIGFEKTQKIQYIRVLETSVATKLK